LKPSAAATAPSKTGGAKKRDADEAFGAGLDDWASLKAKVASDSITRPPSVLKVEAEESKLLTEGADKLPTSDIQEHLAEVFFDNVYGQTYYLLHKPSFMRRLKSVETAPSTSLAR
jgi:hypothetical protein